MKIFFENFRKNTCIFEIDVLIYAGRVSDEVNIRVWRSLVSRLNGVQEASSSNLDTRTKKWETTYVVSHFLFRRKRFEPSNASVRWTLACRQLDGGNTMIFIPVGNENEPNLDTQIYSCGLVGNWIRFVAFYHIFQLRFHKIVA